MTFREKPSYDLRIHGIHGGHHMIARLGHPPFSSTQSRSVHFLKGNRRRVTVLAGAHVYTATYEKSSCKSSLISFCSPVWRRCP